MRVLSGRALPLRWGSRFPGALVNLVTTILCQRPDFPAGNRACAHGAISILTSCSGRNSAPRRHYALILFFCTVFCVATTTLSCPRTSQPGTALRCCPRSPFTVRTKRYATSPKVKRSGRHVPTNRGVFLRFAGLDSCITHARSCGSCLSSRHFSATNFFPLPIVGLWIAFLAAAIRIATLRASIRKRTCGIVPSWDDLARAGRLNRPGYMAYWLEQTARK
jgi:hypothetical protein